MNFKSFNIPSIFLAFFGVILALYAIRVVGDTFSGKAEFDPSFIQVEPSGK